MSDPFTHSSNPEAHRLEIERKQLENDKLRAESVQARYFWLTYLGGISSFVFATFGFITQQDKKGLESEVQKIASEKSSIEKSIGVIRAENEALEVNKDKMMNALSLLEQQKKNLETQIEAKQKEFTDISAKVTPLQKQAELSGSQDLRSLVEEIKGMAQKASIKEPPPASQEIVRKETYTGKAGNLAITSELIWYPSGLVEGSYTYKDDSRRYTLRGSNYADGKLQLSEIKGETKTASLELSKKVTSGAIIWSGSMTNIGKDKRSFPFQIQRAN